MGDTDIDPWGQPPSSAGMKACVLCENPTQSHAVAVAEDDASGLFEPADKDEYDFVFPVCHSCYAEYDGSARKVVHLMNGEHATEALDAVNLTPSSFQAAMQEAESNAGDKSMGVVGEDAVNEFVHDDLVPGDIIDINDKDEAWAVLPRNEDRISKVENSDQIIFPVVEVDPDGDEGSGGGLMDAPNPFEDTVYHAYVSSSQQDGMNFEPIEQIDVVGHTEEVTDIDPHQT